MKASYTIEPLTMKDYPEVYQLWSETEGVGVGPTDSEARVAFYLERNPGMSFVARSDGKVIGAVLGGHDGRRGYLHHLAVRPDWRGMGIGRALVEHCLEKLRQVRIARCNLFVYTHNLSGRAFWEHLGWKERVDLVVMSHDV